MVLILYDILWCRIEKSSLEYFSRLTKVYSRIWQIEAWETLTKLLLIICYNNSQGDFLAFLLVFLKKIQSWLFNEGLLHKFLKQNWDKCTPIRVYVCPLFWLNWNRTRSLPVFLAPPSMKTWISLNYLVTCHKLTRYLAADGLLNIKISLQLKIETLANPLGKINFKCAACDMVHLKIKKILIKIF